MTDKATSTPSNIEPIKDDGFELVENKPTLVSDKPFDKPVEDLTEAKDSFVSESSRILRYLAKPKESGKIMLAHLECLKPVGKDYEALLDIEKRKKNGEDLEELIPWTDAEFDWEKVKELFNNRGLVLKERFNERVRVLREKGDIRHTALELNDAGLTKITALIPEVVELKEE